MSDLRQRHVPNQSPDPNPARPRRKDASATTPDTSPGISLADVLRVALTLILASCGLSYYMTGESILWGYRPWYTRWPVLLRYMQGPLALTPPQLALYNGTDTSLPIYLAVNGSIFDVSANPLVYGPGGHYSFFAGRDATRAFVTGCFDEDLTGDVAGVEEMFIPVEDDDESEAERALTSGQRKVRREQEVRMARARVQRQVAHWEGFFRNHKRYFEVGKVVDEGEAGGEGEKEKRVLCEGGKKQRPKRSDLNRKLERRG